MRLLAPAALPSLAVLFGSPSGYTASPPAQTATSQNTVQPQASSATSLPAGGAPDAGPQASTTSVPATIKLPAGTRVTLALTSPIWAKSVKAGDAIYTVTAFPVVTNNSMAVPPGTYVLGQIDAVTKPSWKDAHALLQMHFSKIIFANGYTVELASAPLQAATATVHVQVSSRNDVLLENGAQFDTILQTPLELAANSVAQAVRRSQPLKFGATKSATLCRPIPATPGTSDTVIPGTPPTIIPGTPGTPEIPCPAPPAVVSGRSGPQIHRQAFHVTSELVVAGKKLAPGSYEVAWLGTDVAVQVEVQQRGGTVVRVPARISVLPENSTADKTVTRTNPDGSVTIASLEFAGERFAVVFD